MTVAGLSLPQISAYDPPIFGEGSLDPMGLAAISDRLADRLIPGIRARMQKVRFVTAMAVSSLVCETLADELSGDDISTPSICFEWLFLEAFIRRLKPSELPSGLPGSMKTRAVLERGERLSAATYLKGPRVFGFHGVYKPFAIDVGIVSEDLAPGPRAVELVRTWEKEVGLDGFADSVTGSRGASIRRRLTQETRETLRNGRCTIKTSSKSFGWLARSLHPDNAGAAERALLRQLVSTGPHALRNELTRLLPATHKETSDNQLLDTIRNRCSPELRAVVETVRAYEWFAKLLDRAFRSLCTISYSMGTQPITPDLMRDNNLFKESANLIPGAYQDALERMVEIGVEQSMEERLGEFGIKRQVDEFIELLINHHEQVQAQKPPAGKRSWFDPLQSGWVVRSAYGTTSPAELDGPYVHPVRVSSLHQFLVQTTA
jgi:hypothetical protein